ncbi:MAG: Inner membrane protein YbhL [Alphaproteobacteria bacterium MarineAlpha5_Bin9]|nr:MAG: Inner membrane protein YbhL [Alphaproteobacteria bacterium MarineAlpha5_Bin9]|tara:strand:- start:28660 stop:29409 length:750 start_codon:yes stop_codon:yes gene_type:complete
MATKPRSYSKSAEEQSLVDQGLRSYMLKVYNYMTTGLLLTGLVAYFFGKASIKTNDYGQIEGLTSLGNALFNSPLQWIVMLAPLGFVFYFSARINRMSISSAQITFWIFASIMGLSLASIFIVFTQASIARVFFISAATFASMSIYGYTTKRDLTKIGGFLFMGLIGIIIASLVNLFVGSSALQFAISVIGVLVFVGLTAYDTQNIKNMYYEGDSETVGGKKALMGALKLYLDFINLFILLLQLFGQRR